MALRVDDTLVCQAAEALLAVAETLETGRGLKINHKMTIDSAKSAVMAAVASHSGVGYASPIMPTGWTEIDIP